MLLLYQKAEKWATRPSVLFGVDPEESPYLAYCIDNSVFVYGTWIDNKRNEMEKLPGKKGGSRNKWTVQQLLNAGEFPGVVRSPKESSVKPVEQTTEPPKKGFMSVTQLMGKHGN